MDVVFHFPGSANVRYNDVTIRCPHADSYTNTETRPGVAAACGVNDKVRRYGEAVTAISLETYGRMDPTSISHLRRFASDFVRPHTRRNPGVLYHQLRYALEHALFFETVDVVIHSLGGPSSLTWSGSREGSRWSSRNA